MYYIVLRSNGVIKAKIPWQNKETGQEMIEFYEKYLQIDPVENIKFTLEVDESYKYN